MLRGVSLRFLTCCLTESRNIYNTTDNTAGNILVGEQPMLRFMNARLVLACLVVLFLFPS